MLKSFPIVKVIKKNWKVIALLVALLVIALLVLALYPKVQEGLNDKQIKATDTSATVSFTSDAATFSVSSAPITGVSGSGDQKGYTISGLKPNSKYTSIKVIDSKKNDAYKGSIITLPNLDNIIPPALSNCDLSNNHSQLDENGVPCAYIKFDAGVDLKVGAQGAGTTTTGFKIDNFEITDNSDPNKPVNLNGKSVVNPDTGLDGWCKVQNMLPGKKYKITVQSTCDVQSQATTVIGVDVDKTQMQKLKSAPSKEINLFTAPMAVKNIIASDPVKNSDNKYDVTVTFDTFNGPDTTYTTSLNCDSKYGMTEIPGAVSNGKGSITIKNIAAGATYKDVTVSANLNCDKPTEAGKANDCKSVCSLKVQSHKRYKVWENKKWVEKDAPTGSTFSITTPPK